MHQLMKFSVSAVRESYWFWPSIMTLIALVLGYLLPYIDALLGVEWMTTVPFLRPMGVDGARSVLTTLAGSILGVAGVAFSITIVAVSFASGNYGPRLIGNFMRDRMNQLVLAIFLATFVYCLAVLSTVHAPYDDLPETLASFVPQISVLFAIALALVSVGALIAYIHHIPESINIMNLAANVGAKLENAIEEMLRENEGGAPRADADVSAWDGPVQGRDAIVRTDGAGYLQDVDLKLLERIASDRDLRLMLVAAPGDFLTTAGAVIAVRPPERLDDETADSLRAAVTLGSNRTEDQDAKFLADQLVEVLGRALSSGVNDPHTAMLCLDWLRAGLSAFARGAPTSALRGSGRVTYTRTTFEELLHGTFGRMRQYASGDRTVVLHAIDVLADLAAIASTDARAEAVVTEMRTLAGSADEQLAESAARREVAQRLADALASVERRRAGADRAAFEAA